MKIEKLNDDKIRITLNMDDLKENHVDYHTFMANSVESQELFLNMLVRAEEEVGFITDDYKLMIEALALADGNFVLTVTRLLPDENSLAEKNRKIPKLSIKRKTPKLNIDKTIYSFNTFEEFCNFCNFLNSSIVKNITDMCQSNSLYLYNNTYYLVIDKINVHSNQLKQFAASVSEFGHFVNISVLFERKLQEYGEIVIPEKSIETCFKYFCKK